MKPSFLDHIVIAVKDIKTTTDFYRTFLGDPDTVEKEQVVFSIGDTKIFFGLPYGEYRPQDKDAYGLNHLAFGVRTLEELKSLEKDLNDGGIKHSGVQIDKYGGREFIWFDDPDGYRLEFYLRA